ncbi:MAG: U32 family peptidase [Methanobacteriaceae archaeon]
MKIPELLAPAGSLEQLKIAIYSGANSVYISGKKFGARYYAKNFNYTEMKEAIDFAHLHNVSVYCTVNTLIKESEMKEALEHVFRIYKLGIDGVLVGDIGLIKAIGENIPNLAIHGSTQLNIHNIEDLKWAKSQNIKRIVAPRELSISEIKEFIDFTHSNDMEIEIFLHGALCYSYSGHCLLSSFKGGRSGNRGMCTQPCRKHYISSLGSEGHLISPRDISLYNDLEKIMRMGIDSLKIEGRIRSDEYIATVVSTYAKAINNRFKNANETEKGLEELKLVFNREFTNSYWNSENKSAEKLYNNIENKENTEINKENKDSKNNNEKYDDISRNKLINPKKPGHHGLFIGKVLNGNSKKDELILNIKTITIPEKGDGLLFESDSGIKFGLELSTNPKIKGTGLVIIKTNKMFKTELEGLAGFKVFITKRKILKDKIKHIHENRENLIKKSELSLSFKLDKNNYPVLEGELKLKNNNLNKYERKVDLSVIGLTPWEKAINKPVTHEKIQEQITKLDDLPFSIKKVNFDYNNKFFAPISDINKIRRTLFEGLKDLVIEKYHPNYNNIFSAKKTLKKYFKNNDFENHTVLLDDSNKKSENKLAIYINSLESLKSINKVNESDLIYQRVYIEMPHNNKRIDNNTNNDGNNSKNHYCYESEINFIESAMDISKNQKYELVWKLPNVLHLETLKSYKKMIDILSVNKNVNGNNNNNNNNSLSIMVSSIGLVKYLSNDNNDNNTNDNDNAENNNTDDISGIDVNDSTNKNYNFNIYCSSAVNIWNKESVLELGSVSGFTISPELGKKDIKSFMNNYLFNNENNGENNNNNNKSNLNNVDILVHGKLELLESKHDLIKSSFNQFKNNNLFIEQDDNGTQFNIKEGFEKSTIIQSSEDLCLIEEIQMLKKIGFKNFVIDGRWENEDYIIRVGGVYYKALNEFYNVYDKNGLKEIIKKLSRNGSCVLTKGNFEKGIYGY